MSAQIMVDLETMGTEVTSVILSIGAVSFDPETGGLGNTFYKEINTNSCLNAGLTVNEKTMDWWQTQPPEVRGLLEQCRSSVEFLPDSLKEFGEYVQANMDPESGNVWGNGASFDNAILAHAYSKVGMELPWPFYKDRCYRTIKSLGPKVLFKRQGILHNALDDAVTQAVHMIKVMKELNITELR